MRQAELLAQFATQAWHANRAAGGGVCPELNSLEQDFRDAAAVAFLSAFGDRFSGRLLITYLGCRR